jgi:hypothetical protein
MVGGAAGGVHGGRRGSPHYAQVPGTARPNLARFQPGLFPLVLGLLGPLFFRASCCVARSPVMEFYQAISMACWNRTVGYGRSARAFPCICIVLYKRTLRCGGRTPRGIGINREIQGVGALSRPGRRCDASIAATRAASAAPRAGNQQRSASACSAPLPTGGRVRPHKNHCTAMTWAQIASIPMNSASDVNAAASCATARTMTHPPLLDRTGTLF